MPRRVIDFDAMWSSDKLAACAPWAQAEYAWLYGLADASGSFELTNLRVIWGRVAAIRQNLSLERLQQVFEEFADKGLLFIWQEGSKRYGHWTNSERPGRLPPASWRGRLERLAPPVPAAALAEYMNAFGGVGNAFGASAPDAGDQATAEQAPPEESGGPSAPLRASSPPHSKGDDGGEFASDGTSNSNSNDGVRGGDGRKDNAHEGGEPIKPRLEAPQVQGWDLDEARVWEEELEEDLEQKAGRAAIGSNQGGDSVSRLRGDAGPSRDGGEAQSVPRIIARAQNGPALAYESAHLRVTERQDAVLADSFPWVDRQMEYRKMNSWLEANPERRPRSASRFAHNWFAKVPGPAAFRHGAGARAEAEVRVGLGVSGPVHVKPEALERIRQREQALHAAAGAGAGGQHSSGQPSPPSSFAMANEDGSPKSHG